jgi:hypothetical protein
MSDASWIHGEGTAFELGGCGGEAMITVDDDGHATFHPDLIAYGDKDTGWLTIPGWQSALAYTRGVGGCDTPEWSMCAGDAVCEAIESGQIPLRPHNERPAHLRAEPPKEKP